jgi:hypothetical protein
MQEAIAPLLESISAAEKRAEEYEKKSDELAAKLRAQAEVRRDVELAEARKRFRAGLAVEILAGQAAANTLDWNWETREIKQAIRFVDAVLNEVGLS